MGLCFQFAREPGLRISAGRAWYSTGNHERGILVEPAKEGPSTGNREPRILVEWFESSPDLCVNYFR